MSLRGMGTPLPVYVTRKTAHGETAEYSLSFWMTLLAMLLVWLNVVVWGVIALIEAGRHFV